MKEAQTTEYQIAGHRDQAQTSVMKWDKNLMKLVRETRWRREYRQEGMEGGYHISRFADGSASITLAQLKAEWPGWSSWEKQDFAQEFRQSGSPDHVEIL